MNVVGLITEYNPLHNGHLYHIKKAKEITKADAVVVVMSGNFVQRGTPAVIDKYERAKMALLAGADFVFELPAYYATASAEYFALGAVSLLNNLGFVTHLVFGSECGDINLLSAIARIYNIEPEFVSLQIKQFLKQGLTYPAARAKAVQEYLEHSANNFYPVSEILNSPNNILGIEYLKALLMLRSPILPMTISRIHSDFHETELTGSISSATAIRKILESDSKDSISKIENSIPCFVYEHLQTHYQKTFPIVLNDFGQLLKYRFLVESTHELASYQDMNLELANRIKGIKFTTHTFEEIVDELKTKNMTQTRIQRALLHILLGQTSKLLHHAKENDIVPYARLLGFRKSSSAYLKYIPNSDHFTLITKLSKALLSGYAKELLSKDIEVAHIYNLIVAEKYSTTLKDEYTRGPVIL